MRDEDKTKEQLIDELGALRQRNAELEALTIVYKRTKEDLRSNTERFNQIIQSITDHVYVIKISGHGHPTTIYLAPQFETLTGYPLARLMNDRELWSSTLIHPDDRQITTTQKAQLEMGKDSEVEYRLVRANGEVIWVQDKARVESKNTYKTVYGVINDITEHKQLEDRLEAIHQLGRELNLLRDEATIIERLLETAVTLLPFNAIACGLVDEIGSKLDFHYRSVHETNQTIRLALPLEDDTGIGVVLMNDHLLKKSIRRLVEKDYRAYFPATQPKRRWLSASMKVGERLIGMLNVESIQSNHFAGNDQQLLQILADLMATAIENARLYDETRLRVEEMAALSMISQVITSTLNLRETLTTVTDHAVRLLDVMAASVTLCDEVRGDIWFEAVSGPNPDFVREFRLSGEQGIVGWVIKHGEPVVVPDVSQDPRFFDGIDQKSGFTTHSILCVPLQAGDRTIGAIEVINKRGAPFDQRDLRLLNWLTMPTITAIENARLFEAEQYAREQAETLREATSTLTSSLDLSQVLDSILIHLEQVIPYDSARIFLCEDEWLHIVAGRGPMLDEEQVVGRQYPADNVLYHEIRSTGRPIILADALIDFRFQHWIGPDYIRGWMGVPLTVRNEVIGYLTLESRQVAAFGQVEADLAQAFTNQAAVAIQNARLFEEVRLGHERLQLLSRRLVEVQETERRHIARELHDEAGQALTSLMVGLRLLERESNCPEALVARVVDLKRMANDILENLHRLAIDLRPASLDHLGLVAALRQYVEGFGQQHGLFMRFEAVRLDDMRLPPTVEINLYRIVQEALTNVARHAQATRADVLIEHRGNRVLTIIEDDGVGFEFESALKDGRLGLLGIRERAEMLGGTLAVESTAGVGTTIFVEVSDADSHPDR